MLIRRQTLSVAAYSALALALSAPILRAQEPDSGTHPAPLPAAKPQEIPITFPRQVVVAEVFSGTVLRVVDAATIIVEREGKTDHSRPETVRLFGLIRPAPGRETAALAYLNDNLKGKSVRVEGRRRRKTDGTLEAVVTQMPDRLSGGLVTSKTPDSSNLVTSPSNLPQTGTPLPTAALTPLNVSLVRLGMAHFDASVTSVDSFFAHRLEEAEDSARKDKSGLWADAAPANGAATSAELPSSK